MDNAMSCVAHMTTGKLGTEGEPKDQDQVLACRDAIHTLDLMPKNLMKTPTIAAVMAKQRKCIASLAIMSTAFVRGWYGMVLSTSKLL